jgi:hypothetical protein
METPPERAGASHVLHEAPLVTALAMPRRRARRRISHGAILVAAVLLASALAFTGGYLTGERTDSSSRGAVLQLVGAAAAPDGSAALRIGVSDLAGNRPLQLSVTGLREVPHGYYELFLIEPGSRWQSCGGFVATEASARTTVRLSLPYPLSAGDRWIVTQERPGQPEPGTAVLRTIQSAPALQRQDS